ncbi:hypothetical protein KJ853_01940 [Patescibacteria group bacterium]|nr:hypothetical protein [Patescibacteria group bacterium]
MKRAVLLMAALAVIALVFLGCATARQKNIDVNIIKNSADKNSERPNMVQIIKGEKPYEIFEKSKALPAKVQKDESPEKREIVYDSQIIPDINLSKYPPLKTTQRWNMEQIRQRIAKTGLEPHFISQSHLVRNRAPNGKMIIQRAKNVLYLGFRSIEPNGKKTFTPVEIAECGNSADGFKEVITPAKTAEKYYDKEVIRITERYQDTQITTIVKKIVLPPPPPPKVKWEWPKEIDYGGGDGGGGGGGCGGGTGASR